MIDMVCIYGVFNGKRCVYVGRTRQPEHRERSHFQRFRDQFTPKFRVLRLVEASEAASVERKLIMKFHRLGQANYNKNHRLRRPNRLAENKKIIPAGISLPPDLLSKLGKRAFALGLSRSKIVRDILAAHFKQQASR